MILNIAMINHCDSSCRIQTEHCERANLRFHSVIHIFGWSLPDRFEEPDEKEIEWEDDYDTLQCYKQTRCNSVVESRDMIMAHNQ